MVRRYLQRWQRRGRSRLGSVARRFLGNEQSPRNAVLLPQRRRSERARCDLRFSLHIGDETGEQSRHSITSQSQLTSSYLSLSRSRSRNVICAEFILHRAISSGKNSARSTSGFVWQIARALATASSKVTCAAAGRKLTPIRRRCSARLAFATPHWPTAPNSPAEKAAQVGRGRWVLGGVNRMG